MDFCKQGEWVTITELKALAQITYIITVLLWKEDKQKQ